MADASNTSTWLQTTPHRPTLGELGGGAKQNNPKFPPDPVKHPRAEEFNQFSQQIAAIGGCIYLAKLHIQFAAGVPSIFAVQSPAGLIAGQFTIVDNGAGDTTIWWTVGSNGMLPPTTGFPEASVAQDGDTTINAVYTSVSGNPAVRVKTRTGGSLADANFVVTLN